MKYLSIFLCSLFLAACGGGDETPVAIIKTSVPHPVANAATVSGGSGVAVHMYQALYGMAPSNATLSAHTAQATSDPSAFARTLTNDFASTSSTALAKLVLDNLNVTAATVTAVNAQGQSEYTILLDALGQMFAFYGTDARGQIILNATNLLAGLESDATYGATAITYNNQASVNFSYSSNSASTVAAAISTATANAGATQNVTTGTLVTLDASASKADVGRTLTYAWALTSRPAGSTAALSSATSTKPNFTADMAGTYVATLIVNDGRVNSTAATVSIAVKVANTAPVANPGVAQNVAVGALVTLDGSASSDANSDPLTYLWALTSRPAGSSAALSSATSVKPTFTADVAGTYVVSLVVNDGKVSSGSVNVSIVTAVPTLTLLSVSSSFFGGSDTVVSMPFSTTSSASASIQCVGNGCATVYDVDTFRLRASGQNYTITNLTATNLAAGSSIVPLFSGLSNGQTIIDGSTVTFKLQSPFTRGSTVNLRYAFTIQETGVTFVYTVQLRTN
jgi:chitinase